MRVSKPKVLIYARREEKPEIIQTLIDIGCDVQFGDPAWTLPRGEHEDAFVEAARDAVVLMGTSIRHTPISRRILEASQRLRLVAKYTVGVDDVDTDAATELGIMVSHAPTEENVFAVAEQAVAMMLGILKKVRERDAAVRAGEWRTPASSTTYFGSRMTDGHGGLTVGLVGLGRIGTRVAQLLAPWRVRVIAYDPHIPPAQFLLAGVPSVDYETLLREADIVSFHVTLTKETRFMLDAEQVAMMKPGAIVVNTARGKVIREQAVADALRDGRLRAAAIDAFEEEPLPADSPLRALPQHQTLFSPHAAAYNGSGELFAGINWALRSVLTALKGDIPDNVYNREVLPRWRERFGGASVLDAEQT